MKNRIRELRHERKMTLPELATELKKNNLKIAPDTISKYEREDREPKLDTWVKLADYFSVPVDYLQGLSNNREFHLERDMEVYETRSKLIELDKFSELFLNPVNFVDEKVPEVNLSEDERRLIVNSIHSYQSFLDVFIPFSDSENIDNKKAVIYGATQVIEQLFNKPLINFFTENLEHNGEQEKNIQEREREFDKFNIQMFKKIEKILKFIKETERISYDNIQKTFDYIDSLPDDHTK